MGAGKSTIPLCSSAVRALRWRFTMFTPSTVSRPVLGYTRMTFPSFPLSSPRITRTVSPFVMRMRTRSELPAWCLRCTTFGRSVFLYLRMRISDHLGSERHDLHVLLLAQLARNRAEDARRARLAGLVDDDHRVLV